MKKSLYILICIPALLLAIQVKGQTLYTKTDSVILLNDTLVRLKLPVHRGNTQWQKSVNGVNWTNISGKTADSLVIRTNTESAYRAVISEGTCLPVYSGYAGIVFNKPSVETDSIKNVTQISGLGIAHILSEGGAPVTAKGLCWNTTGSPTVSDSKTNSGNGPGSFSGSLTGLKVNTKYYVRAYATNAKGTGYSSTKSFTTSTAGSPAGTFTDNRDGKIYKWVQTGTQVWMAENLAWLPSVNPPENKFNGAPCYYVQGYSGTDVAAAKATANFSTYGVLYNWTAAAGSNKGSYTNPSGVRGACPQGWHLPSDAEWSYLTDYLNDNGFGFQGSGEDIAKSLASKTSWLADTTSGAPGKDPSINNVTGFSALAGGILAGGGFSPPGYIASWWSSSDTLEGSWYRDLTYLYPGVPRYVSAKFYGFSVRCIRDTGTDPSNEAPNVPYNFSPVNNASVIPLKPVLMWDASDPEGDPLTFDIYLGNSAGFMSVISSNQTGRTWTTTTTLSGGTDYYWKIVAKDNKGLSTEGPVLKFSTTTGNLNGTFTDSRDGKVYKWVQIGNQGWMAENLAWLPSVNPSSSNSTTGKRYYVYGYEGTDIATAKATQNFTSYGVLYNWPAAVDGSPTSSTSPSRVRGACPAGWHLPSDKEWITLIRYLINNGYGYQGSGEDIAKSLASQTGWRNDYTAGDPGYEPTLNNTTGFNGLPAGESRKNIFDEMNLHAMWWSSTETDSTSAWFSMLGWDEPIFGIAGDITKDYGYSVRCIRD